MSLGLVSPLLNRGVRSRWLASLPGAGSKMLVIDSSGDTAFQDIPVAAWGSITGTLSAQTDLQNALNAKADSSALSSYLPLSGGTLTGAVTANSTAALNTNPKLFLFQHNGVEYGSIQIRQNWNGLTRASINVDHVRANGNDDIYGFGALGSGAGKIWFSSNGTNMHIAMQGGIAMTFPNYGGPNFQDSIGFWGGQTYNPTNPDLYILRDAANTFGQRNSTNAQTFRLYGTYTDASNYRRLYLSSTTAGAFTIGVEGAGTGASGNTLRIPNRLGIGVNTPASFRWLDIVDSEATGNGVFASITNTSTDYYSSSGWIMRVGVSNVGGNISAFGSSIPQYGVTSGLNFSTSTATDNIAFRTGSALINGTGTAARFFISSGGNIGINTQSPTSIFHLVGLSQTGLTASTEFSEVNFDLSSTKTFAAGNITTQRAFRIQAPTYSFASASTITTASTLSISGRPISGTNATITNGYALNVESGNTILNGDLIIGVFGSTFSRISFNRGVTHTFDICQPYPECMLFRQDGSGFASFWGGTGEFGSYTGGLMLTGGGLSWCSSATIGNSQDAPNLCVMRDAADILAQRRSTNSQTLRIYNTFTNASNYIRQSLSFTTYSSTVHAQLGAEGAGTGAVNIPFVITPRGTGAFILGPMPDGTATGGNARGAYAVDLQTLRSAASEVASGESSFVAGRANTASNFRSVALGFGNSVSQTNGFAAGNSNTVSGSGVENGIALGASNTASSGSAVAVGFANLASGSRAFATGDSTQSTAFCTSTFGHRSVADRYAMTAFSAGWFSANGDAQRIGFVARIKTTNNTATTMMLDGSSARLTIPSGKLFLFVAKIVGVKSDGTSRACYVRKGAIINIAGTTSLVGTIDTVGTDVEDNAATDVAITADNTNDALDISVTGITSETWRWVAVVEGVEVAYGT